MIRNALLNRENWDHLAVIDSEILFSYRDLAQKAAAVANQLPQTERKNIALYLPNSANYIAAFFGVLMAGMTLFPLGTQLTIHELIPLLTQADVQAAVTSSDYRPLFDEIVKVVPIQIIYLEELETFTGSEFPAPKQIEADEPMILLNTSGTTGRAKIVQLSERNVAFSTLAYLDKMDFEKFPQDEIRLTLGTPYSSAYGLLILTACTIRSIPIVVLKEGFTLDALYKAAETHRITHFEGGVSVGLLMEQMAGRPVSYDISSFRYFGLAGSKLPFSTQKRLIESYPNVEFWSGYGMTEAGPLIAKPYKKVNLDKPDSVGTKIDCVTILVDVDGVRMDIPYVKGEIVVKGPNVMLGYYQDAESTRKILKDGYLYTGDIGYFDEDGDLYICGRKKNVIIVRGFNVHAEEVEACIQNSGLVQDCFVYGETDSHGDEVVCADIIPITSDIQAEQIQIFCQEHLAKFKQPRSIRIVAAIRKTATGKTERT